MPDSPHLPRESYFASAWQQKERELLFGQSWVFAGVLSDFREVGDFCAVQSGVFPLVVLRNKDGGLVAYHNICRHRGATLVDDASGNCGKALICPYHRWTYDLEGKFRGAPQMASCFPDVDRSALGLKPAAVGVFRDLVLVNANPHADFAEWIAPLEDRAWPHDLDAKDITEGAPLVYDLKCDWKVFVENAIDGYHLAYLHEKTLGGPPPDRNLWERAGDHMIWYATDGDDGVRHRLPGKIREQGGTSSMVKSASEGDYGGVYFLFPNTLIVPTPFGFSVSTLQPTAPGRCRLTVRNWVGPWQSKDDRKHIQGYDPKTGIISSDNWTKHPLQTGEFQTEDVWICEKVQRGLESPAFEPGPLSKGAGAEDPVGWFRSQLRGIMMGGRGVN